MLNSSKELPFWSQGRLPTGQTLHKYGLSLQDWLELFNSQQGACAICKTPFAGRRANVDHVHVKGWNQMAPEQRRQYIRGLLCYQCNKFMCMRGVTSTKLWNGFMYMRAYEVRITKEALAAQSRNLDATQKRVKRRNVRHSDQQQDHKDQSG